MPFSKLNIVVTTLILNTFILQGCSLTSKVSANINVDKSIVVEGTDIKAIGQDIIDMGVIPKDNPSSIDNTSNNQNTTVDTEQTSIQHLPLEKTQYQQFLTQQALVKTTLSTETKAHYQLALAKMKNQNWLEAIVLLNEVIELSPDLSGAYLNKALSQYHLKQFDSAISSLKTAEIINTNNPYIYNLQGVLAREQGKFIAAEKYYQKALTIWPNYPQAHLNIAVLFELYRGDFTKAKAHYQAYLLLKPNDKKTKQWLAGLEIKIATRKGS
jgi:tetratricopeptide (TPR) repeat protein